ncbi:OmpA family protein [Ferrimonas pelagia]|uniref:OmpA family protein n=1 Tax=Ferrimonas pelagia TaxID=1177826 RepID=A0ABP9F7U7_9GAMM
MNTKIFALISLYYLAGCSWQADPYLFADQAAALPDADLDGVINERDLCADTGTEHRVDNNGCGQQHLIEKVTPAVVYFDLDQSLVRPNQKAEINRAIELLTTNADNRAVLVGHTDQRASNEYNLQLSYHRVESVKQALLAGGVTSQQLTSNYVGEEQPRVNANTESGHAKNRRVEIQFTELSNHALKRWHIFSVDVN